MVNRLVVCVIAILMLGGCASHTKLTNVADKGKSYDQTYLNNNFELIAENAEVDLGRAFFYILPIGDLNSLDDAYVVSELLEKYEGDLVTDVSIESKFGTLLYVSVYYVYATGNVWKRKEI